MLQPSVKKSASYIKHTTQNIVILEKLECNQEWIMGTLDVNSLYTVIINEQGVAVMKTQLQKNSTLCTEQIN